MNSSNTIYTDYQPGTRNTLVLYLHGDNHNHTTGSVLLKTFQEHGFPTFTFDRPGHGFSKKSSQRFSLDGLLDTLHQLIEQRTERRLIITGHSSGGMLGYAYAEKHPEHLQGIVTVEALNKAPTVLNPTLKSHAPAYLATSKQLYTSGEPVNYQDYTHLSGKELLRFGLERTHPDIVKEQLHTFIDFQLPHLSLDVPVLALRGEKSLYFTQAHFEAFRTHAHNLTLGTLKGEHSCIIQDPEGIQTAVTDFITKHYDVARNI